MFSDHFRSGSESFRDIVGLRGFLEFQVPLGYQGTQRRFKGFQGCSSGLKRFSKSVLEVFREIQCFQGAQGHFKEFQGVQWLFRRPQGYFRWFLNPAPKA